MFSNCSTDWLSWSGNVCITLLSRKHGSDTNWRSRFDNQWHLVKAFSKFLLPIIARSAEDTLKVLWSEITDLTSKIRERDEQITSLQSPIMNLNTTFLSISRSLKRSRYILGPITIEPLIPSGIIYQNLWELSLTRHLMLQPVVNLPLYHSHVLRLNFAHISKHTFSVSRTYLNFLSCSDWPHRSIPNNDLNHILGAEEYIRSLRSPVFTGAI